MNTSLHDTDLPSEMDTPVILIVDDNPANLGIIVDYLEEYGFTILVARNGESGLDKARYAQPDLILLDVMMPDIDGFETCQRLKSDSQTQDIPVIFMTALHETQHKVRAFEAGAVDYVTKPLHQEEVLARVTTHLKIRDLTRNLQHTNRQLSKVNADKDKLFAILAHDLRGAFSPLMLSAEVLARHSGALNMAQVTKTSQSIYHSVQQIYNLLENLLQWAQMQLGHLDYEPLFLDFSQTVERTINLTSAVATTKGIHLQNLLPPRLIAYGDRNMLDVVVRNLLTNALKFTPNNGTVIVSATGQSELFIEIAITDTGVGISPENLAKLLQVGSHYSTPGTNKERGSGLGLMLCQEMMVQNGGKLRIESEVNKGTTVYLTLPTKPKIN